MKFSPKPPGPKQSHRKGFFIYLGNSDNMLDLKSQTEKLAQARKLSVAELVRQMIQHCLAELK